VQALRRGHPPGEVHEPLVVLLSPLSAEAAGLTCGLYALGRQSLGKSLIEPWLPRSQAVLRLATVFFKNCLETEMGETGHCRIVVGVGAAAGGLLVAALGQLASAPSARADVDITDVIASIDATDAVGQTALGDAATFFSSGDVPDGLAASFTGLDDILFNAQNDLFVNGYEALQGIDGPYSAQSFVDLPTPTDLAATSADVASYFDTARESLSTAATDFAAGDLGNGLGQLVDATEDWVAASQIELIGLVDTLIPVAMQ
jgi:hypothetical protein